MLRSGITGIGDSMDFGKGCRKTSVAVSICLACVGVSSIVLAILQTPDSESAPKKQHRRQDVGVASESSINASSATSQEGDSGGRTETPLDLLALVQERDAVLGGWSLDHGKLISPAVAWARIQLPCAPPREYDLKLSVTRLQGDDSLNLGLAREGKQFMIVLDGNGGSDTGLDLIGGKGFSKNETSFKGQVLPRQVSREILVSVRDEGLTVSVGERAICQWRGRYETLGLLSSWTVYDNCVLFIGTWATSYRIEAISLMPVSGNATILR